MPGLNGQQLLERLRGRAATSKTTAILMASKPDITEKLKMLSINVEDYVEKPFFLRETSSRIKRTIDRIALEKMAREAPGGSPCKLFITSRPSTTSLGWRSAH